MAKEIAQVTDVKKPAVVEAAATQPLTKPEQVPSNWDIQRDKEEGQYIFANVVTNRVIKGTIADFNALINPKE